MSAVVAADVVIAAGLKRSRVALHNFKGKDRGLIAREDISAGTLLLQDTAVAVCYDDDDRDNQRCVFPDEPTGAEQLSIALARALSVRPDLIPCVLALYPSSKQLAFLPSFPGHTKRKQDDDGDDDDDEDEDDDDDEDECFQEATADLEEETKTAPTTTTRIPSHTTTTNIEETETPCSTTTTTTSSTSPFSPLPLPSFSSPLDPAGPYTTIKQDKADRQRKEEETDRNGWLRFMHHLSLLLPQVPPSELSRFPYLVHYNALTLGLGITPSLTHRWGIGLFPHCAMLNHSCWPNAVWYTTHTPLPPPTSTAHPTTTPPTLETSTPTPTPTPTATATTTTTTPPTVIAHVRALRPIKKGEEVCISYVHPHQPRLHRRRQIVNCFDFTCACAKCGPLVCPGMGHIALSCSPPSFGSMRPSTTLLASLLRQTQQPQQPQQSQQPQQPQQQQPQQQQCPLLPLPLIDCLLEAWHCPKHGGEGGERGQTKVKLQLTANTDQTAAFCFSPPSPPSSPESPIPPPPDTSSAPPSAPPSPLSSPPLSPPSSPPPGVLSPTPSLPRSPPPSIPTSPPFSPCYPSSPFLSFEDPAPDHAAPSPSSSPRHGEGKKQARPPRLHVASVSLRPLASFPETTPSSSESSESPLTAIASSSLHPLLLPAAYLAEGRRERRDENGHRHRHRHNHSCNHRNGNADTRHTPKGRLRSHDVPRWRSAPSSSSASSSVSIRSILSPASQRFAQSRERKTGVKRPVTASRRTLSGHLPRAHGFDQGNDEDQREPTRSTSRRSKPKRKQKRLRKKRPSVTYSGCTGTRTMGKLPRESGGDGDGDSDTPTGENSETTPRNRKQGVRSPTSECRSMSVSVSYGRKSDSDSSSSSSSSDSDSDVDVSRAAELRRRQAERLKRIKRSPCHRGASSSKSSSGSGNSSTHSDKTQARGRTSRLGEVFGGKFSPRSNATTPSASDSDTRRYTRRRGGSDGDCEQSSSTLDSDDTRGTQYPLHEEEEEEDDNGSEGAEEERRAGPDQNRLRRWQAKVKPAAGSAGEFLVQGEGEGKEMLVCSRGDCDGMIDAREVRRQLVDMQQALAAAKTCLNTGRYLDAWTYLNPYIDDALPAPSQSPTTSSSSSPSPSPSPSSSSTFSSRVHQLQPDTHWLLMECLWTSAEAASELHAQALRRSLNTTTATTTTTTTTNTATTTPACGPVRPSVDRLLRAMLLLVPTGHPLLVERYLRGARLCAAADEEWGDLFILGWRLFRNCFPEATEQVFARQWAGHLPRSFRVKIRALIPKLQ